MTARSHTRSMHKAKKKAAVRRGKWIQQQRRLQNRQGFRARLVGYQQHRNREENEERALINEQAKRYKERF